MQNRKWISSKLHLHAKYSPITYSNLHVSPFPHNALGLCSGLWTFGRVSGKGDHTGWSDSEINYKFVVGLHPNEEIPIKSWLVSKVVFINGAKNGRVSVVLFARVTNFEYSLREICVTVSYLTLANRLIEHIVQTWTFQAIGAGWNTPWFPVSASRPKLVSCYLSPFRETHPFRQQYRSY